MIEKILPFQFISIKDGYDFRMNHIESFDLEQFSIHLYKKRTLEYLTEPEYPFLYKVHLSKHILEYDSLQYLRGHLLHGLDTNGF